MKKVINSNWFRFMLYILIFISIWELLSQLNVVNNFILPPFSKVVSKLITDIFNSNLFTMVGNSLLIVVEGMIISTLLAFIIVILCYKSKIIETLMEMLTTIFLPLPSMAMLPLIIMWFGIGSKAMLILMSFGVFWTFLRQFLDSMKRVPIMYQEWSENIELSSFKTFYHITLGSILPEFLGIIRIGWGRSWRALIGAELVFGLIGDKGGLGYYLNYNRVFGKMDGVLAGIIIIIIISVVVEKLVLKNIEHYTIERWGIIK